MASQRLQKGTEIFEMFQDYWKLLQENWIVEDKDSYWDKVVSDCDHFYKKYKTPFAKDLILVYTNELERKCRDER